VKLLVFGEMLEDTTSIKILALHAICIFNILSLILCDLCNVPKYVNIEPGYQGKLFDIILKYEY
jgi:hypothetical protein